MRHRLGGGMVALGRGERMAESFRLSVSDVRPGVRGAFCLDELPDEYVVLAVHRNSTRGNPLMAITVAPKHALDDRREILFMDRAELPAIEVNRHLCLTEYSFGKCKVYRESFPR